MKCALLFVLLPAVVLANNYGQQRVQTPVQIPGKVPVRPGSGYGGSAQQLNQGQRNPTGYGNQGINSGNSGFGGQGGSHGSGGQGSNSGFGGQRGNTGYSNQGPVRTPGSGSSGSGYGQGINQGPIRTVPGGANTGYGSQQGRVHQAVPLPAVARPNGGFTNQNQGRLDPVRPGGYGQGAGNAQLTKPYNPPGRKTGY